MASAGVTRYCSGESANAPRVNLEAYRAPLRRTALRFLKSYADAEDIVQEAFLRWHTSAPRDTRHPQAWLVTVVTRLCIDRLRVRNREALVDSFALVDMLTSSAEHDKAMDIESEIALTLRRLAERASLEESLALILREGFCYTYEELARVLHRRQDACRQLVHRAKVAAKAARPMRPDAASVSQSMVSCFIAALRNFDEDAAIGILREALSRARRRAS
jgi:RNA polymerase sigma-70 factor (ECF subfamily)